MWIDVMPLPLTAHIMCLGRITWKISIATKYEKIDKKCPKLHDYVQVHIVAVSWCGCKELEYPSYIQNMVSSDYCYVLSWKETF